MHRHIGVFDSGFGGLEVLRSLTSQLPAYSYMYLADTARAPYGDRTPTEIAQFTHQAIDFLRARQCDLIIIACNSASCHTLYCPTPLVPNSDPDTRNQCAILGVPDPCSKKAAALSKNKRIGVLATAATVASGVYDRECRNIDPTIQVFQQACPALVPMIESGQHTSSQFTDALRNYLETLQASAVDTIILGCTHYGLVVEQVRALAPNVELVVAGATVSQYIATFLTTHPDLEHRLAHTHQRQFYSTDPSKHFDTLASEFFGSPVKAEPATLEENTR